MKKQTISYKEIMGFNPCYDPVEIGMPKNYEASIVDFIGEYRIKVAEKNDIVWVLVRKKYLSGKELRLFATCCARQVQHLMKDSRSIKALDVAEKYANGEASKSDLTEANAAAFAAAAAAAAAYDAAYDAAYARAADAARAAAFAADDAAADDAAYDAAYATRAAIFAAFAANDDTANADAHEAQIDKLSEIFKSRL